MSMGLRIWKDWARRSLAAAERGQTLVEYALIIALISLGTVAAMTLLKTQIVQVFSDVVDQL
jgi:Flp pilus assembly pilin Flp